MTPPRYAHFPMLLLYSFCAACVIGFLSRGSTASRIRSSLWTFISFVALAVAIAWLLYPFSH
jgi:uncharacterized membrane protein